MPRYVNAPTIIAMAGMITAATFGLSIKAPKASAIDNAASNSPVVLELYQSQGCSSCPPALAVLNAVADRADVLALNFAVTYWDQLGWKDSFAQPAFSARQWDYARAGRRSNVQTPQMIVDGRVAILGSRKNEVDAAIASHRLALNGPKMTMNNGSIIIGDSKVAQRSTVWLVDYDPRNVAVPIRAGENGGRTLAHRNIVRRLTAIGGWTGRQVTLPLPRAEPDMARAILVQKSAGGEIIAALKI
jgi:hypothetical protein